MPLHALRVVDVIAELLHENLVVCLGGFQLLLAVEIITADLAGHGLGLVA